MGKRAVFRRSEDKVVAVSECRKSVVGAGQDVESQTGVAGGLVEVLCFGGQGDAGEESCEGGVVAAGVKQAFHFSGCRPGGIRIDDGDGVQTLCGEFHPVGEGTGQGLRGQREEDAHHGAEIESGKVGRGFSPEVEGLEGNEVPVGDFAGFRMGGEKELSR